MNKEDKAFIDKWDGEGDENHTLDVIIKPEFEDAVRQSPDVDKGDIVTAESEAERWGGEPEDYEIDELQLNHYCPSFWLDVEHKSLVEWVAEELG
ncbi:hypothetical protein OAE23_02485, partial [Synechococcus sp. AH-551-E11]